MFPEHGDHAGGGEKLKCQADRYRQRAGEVIGEADRGEAHACYDERNVCGPDQVGMRNRKRDQCPGGKPDSTAPDRGRGMGGAIIRHVNESAPSEHPNGQGSRRRARHDAADR